MMHLLSLFPILVAHLPSPVLSTQEIQEYFGFRRSNNPHSWRRIQPHFADSFENDCTQWLKSRPTSLVYPYGVNTTSSGANAIVSCLQRADAGEARCTITSISVAFPFAGEPNYKQQPIYQITDMLPNLVNITWPNSRRKHAGHKKLVEWARLNYRPSAIKRKHCPSTDSSISFGNWDVAVPDSYLDLPPYFIECNADAVSLYSGSQDQLIHLHETLINCPNVRSLSLDLGSPYWFKNLFFPFRSGDRFPKITNLRILGYPWDLHHRRVENLWQHSAFSFDHFAPIRGDAARWKTAMDWSKLKSLDINLPSRAFLDTFQGELKELESLTIRPYHTSRDFAEALFDGGEKPVKLGSPYSLFINSLPPLKELNLNGVAGILNVSEIIKTHGPNLQILAVHGGEFSCPRYSKCGFDMFRPLPVLSIKAFKSLSEQLPKLEQLELDVNENPQQFIMPAQRVGWVADLINLSGSFPKLRDATLHFLRPQPDDADDQCTVYWQGQCMLPRTAKPKFDAEVSLKVFRNWRGDEQRKERRLERLTLYVDAWRGPRDVWRPSIPAKKWLCSVDNDGSEECHEVDRPVKRHDFDPDEIFRPAGFLDEEPANIIAQEIRVASGWTRRFGKFGLKG